MTAEDADAFLQTSRLELAGWLSRKVDKNIQDAIKLAESEIAALKVLGQNFPARNRDIVALTMDWGAFRDGLRSRAAR